MPDGAFGAAGGAKSSSLPDNALCQFRMTLTTLTPITTSDVTAATTLYITPYRGNYIGLLTGASRWRRIPSAEFSIPVPATTVTMYDLFVRLQSGYPYPQAIAWTNDTTRAQAISLRDGIYVLTDDPRMRYIGSFRTTDSSGQTEDSGDRGSLVECKRYVWNYYNRVPRRIRIIDATGSWSYSTNTWRSWDNNTANRVSFVIGVSENPVFLRFDAFVRSTSATDREHIGIDLDGTTANDAQVYTYTAMQVASQVVALQATYDSTVAIGYHFLQLLEIAGAAGTSTWFGDAVGANNQTQAGAIGWVEG